MHLLSMSDILMILAYHRYIRIRLHVVQYVLINIYVFQMNRMLNITFR